MSATLQSKLRKVRVSLTNVCALEGAVHSRVQQLTESVVAWLIGFFAGEDLPDAEGLNQYAKEMLSVQRDIE